MRLQVSTAAFKHKEFVTGCGFAGSDLYTCSDDKTIRKIKSDGEDGGQIGETLASFPTDLHWCPSASKGQSDIFACGCSDGTFLLMTRVGRLDPKQPVKAHEVTPGSQASSAVSCCQRSHQCTRMRHPRCDLFDQS
jgi:hypothetical protein